MVRCSFSASFMCFAKKHQKTEGKCGKLKPFHARQGPIEPYLWRRAVRLAQSQDVDLLARPLDDVPRPFSRFLSNSSGPAICELKTAFQRRNGANRDGVAGSLDHQWGPLAGGAAADPDPIENQVSSFLFRRCVSIFCASEEGSERVQLGSLWISGNKTTKQIRQQKV